LLSDDPETLKDIILAANSRYIIIFTSHKLFGYIPK